MMVHVVVVCKLSSYILDATVHYAHNNSDVICLFYLTVVSMKLSYILKTSHFFSSFDSEFFDSGTPENEQDNVKQVQRGRLWE